MIETYLNKANRTKKLIFKKKIRHQMDPLYCLSLGKSGVVVVI